jgi:hypothetical protein
MPDKIKLDFTGVSAGFEPLPVGKYNVRVDKAEYGTSQNSGQPKVEVTLKVTNPPKYRGRIIWNHLSLQQQALFRVKQLLIALGYPKEELEGKIDVDLTDIRGMECTVTVAHKQREDGSVQMNVTKFEELKDPDELEAVETSSDSAGGSAWDQLR